MFDLLIWNGHDLTLDKFERQVVSYGLSGDPSVLLILGDRIIREFREHLDIEDQLSRKMGW